MNIPNFITLIRLLLIPGLVIFLMEGRYGWALIVFFVAGLSDGLDGFLARLLKKKTVLGACIDPIADKLLLSTSFITLAILQQMPGWMAVMVVSRDIIIVTGIGILLLNHKKFAIKPTFSSKMTTFFQLLTVLFFLARNYIDEYWFLSRHLLLLTALMTLLSGLHYIIVGIGILNQSEEASAPVDHQL